MKISYCISRLNSPKVKFTLGGSWSSLTKDVRDLLAYLVPTLETVGEVSVRSAGAAASAASQLNKVLKRDNDSSSFGGAFRDDKGLDNMEQVYLMALKGERDNSVVS